MTRGQFATVKRAANLKQGYKETKGFQNCYCNRAACQAPPAGKRQSYMRDFEHNTDARLYYCEECTYKFNKSDMKFREPPRCTWVED